MLEPFIASLGWVGQKAVDTLVSKSVERGVDRFMDRQRQTVVVPAAPTAPARHRLGNVTSDVDIVVRSAFAERRPVLPAFQTVPGRGERPRGVTVPTVLGEITHLTLPRDDYLISALVLDPPADFGDRPVVRGVGWIRSWVAGTATARLTIETTTPTTELLEKLGLRTPDGAGPVEPPKAAVVSQRPGPTRRPFPDVDIIIRAAEAVGRQAGAEAEARQRSAEAEARRRPAADPRCRATTSPAGPRCGSGASRNGLCVVHDAAVQLGEALYDYGTRQRIT